MSRQLRRQRERELQKLGSKICHDGLPIPHNPEATLALAVAVRDLFRNERIGSRASEAAAVVNLVFDLTMQRLPQPARARPLACGRGCNYCCHIAVMATAPEVFLIARELRARHATTFAADVSGRCDAVSQANHTPRVGRKIPCPLLRDGLCSVYTVRPMVCRKHTSFDVSACISEYEGRKSDIPIRRFDQEVFEVCVAALMAGMLLWADRACVVYELAGALRVALEDDQAEQNWLSGETVFDGVATQDNVPGIAEHAVFLLRRLASVQL
jgi:Fe-S-cluster containining protein